MLYIINTTNQQNEDIDTKVQHAGKATYKVTQVYLSNAACVDSFLTVYTTNILYLGINVKPEPAIQR